MSGTIVGTAERTPDGKVTVTAAPRHDCKGAVQTSGCG